MESEAQELISDIKTRLARLKVQGGIFKKRRGLETYDDFVLAIDSADFYLEHLAMAEVITEIEKALAIIRQ